MTGEGQTHFEHVPDQTAEALTVAKVGELEDSTMGLGPEHVDTELSWPVKDKSKNEESHEPEDLEMKWDTSDQLPN